MMDGQVILRVCQDILSLQQKSFEIQSTTARVLADSINDIDGQVLIIQKRLSEIESMLADVLEKPDSN